MARKTNADKISEWGNAALRGGQPEWPVETQTTGGEDPQKIASEWANHFVRGEGDESDDHAA